MCEQHPEEKREVPRVGVRSGDGDTPTRIEVEGVEDIILRIVGSRKDCRIRIITEGHILQFNASSKEISEESIDLQIIR